MSTNKYLPHVLVLPEDDANRQMANGFWTSVTGPSRRQIQVLPEAGGWTNVVESFLKDEVPEMRNCPERIMILLIDFDESSERLRNVKAQVPVDLKDRVFVIGSWSEPEKLRQSMGSFERIGRETASDCREETNYAWGHDLLKVNVEELKSLRQKVRPILFPR